MKVRNLQRNKKNTKESADSLFINVRVEPRSSRPGIAGPYGDALKVRLSSPPAEGKANRELIDLLAGELNIPRKNISIVSGQSSKNKLVKLSGAQEIRLKLAALMKQGSSGA